MNPFVRLLIMTIMFSCSQNQYCGRALTTLTSTILRLSQFRDIKHHIPLCDHRETNVITQALKYVMVCKKKVLQTCQYTQGLNQTHVPVDVITTSLHTVRETHTHTHVHVSCIQTHQNTSQTSSGVTAGRES